MERKAAERRRRSTVRDAIAVLDGLIAELEELNLAGFREVPASFRAELDRLADVVPAGLLRTETLPPNVHRMMDYCFELQDRLITRRLLASLLPELTNRRPIDGDGTPIH